MSKTKLLAVALATTALAVPAQAGGLLRAGSNCLCQTLNGLHGNGTHGATPGGGATGSGMGHQGMISGRGSAALNGALGVTTARSIDRHSGKFNGSIGLAGSVSSASNAALGAHAPGHAIGLAGHSSTSASVNKQIGIGLVGVRHGNSANSVGLANVSVLNRTGTSGRHLANVAALNGTGGMAGKVVNVSALNRTGTTGRSLVNVAALNGSGGTAGKIVNVSALNRTGTTGRSLVNVAALNGSGGTAGKVANVSILNKTGTTGRSLANVAVLNGSGGTAGKLVNVAALNGSNTVGHSVANVAILNGRHGNGGTGGGGAGLPHGIRIINGVPCGPDGKPLTGSAAVAVMAVIGPKGGHSGPVGGSGGPGNGPSQGNEQPAPTPTASGHARDRDMADRKDLWWPPHPEQQSDHGRLEDH